MGKPKEDHPWRQSKEYFANKRKGRRGKQGEARDWDDKIHPVNPKWKIHCSDPKGES